MRVCAVFILISTEFYQLTESFIWNVGNCAIHFEEPCSKSVVKFVYHSPRNGGATLLDPFHIAETAIKYRNKSLKLLIHGYGGLGVDLAIRNVSAAYKEANVPTIIVDWSSLATIPCYPIAFFNTWHVGNCVAVLSVSLAKSGIPPNRIHLIGFSLGAHIASFASNQVQKVLGLSYQRITGLDPALPLFATYVKEWKLDATDAQFVDVYHTSAGSFGKLEAIGHVDFYINGGAIQPVCMQAHYPQLCSHIMAGYYYASTIRKFQKYLAYACPSFLHWFTGFCPMRSKTGMSMGEHVKLSLRGIYFVDAKQRPNAIE